MRDTESSFDDSETPNEAVAVKEVIEDSGEAVVQVTQGPAHKRKEIDIESQILEALSSEDRLVFF